MSTTRDYVMGVGPAAPKGSQCQCGREAIVQCEGCGRTCCRGCWWRHGLAGDPHRVGERSWVGIDPERTVTP